MDREGRPYFGKRIDELESLFRDGDCSVRVLSIMDRELKCRGTLRARSLLKKVMAARRSRLSKREGAEARDLARVEHSGPEAYGQVGIAGEPVVASNSKFVGSLGRRRSIDRKVVLRNTYEAIGKRIGAVLVSSAQSTAAFFDVEPRPGAIRVALNANHPIAPYLGDVMDSDVERLTEDELRERVARLAIALSVLIYAWGRYEDEQTGRGRRLVRDARVEWGKYGEELLGDRAGAILRTWGNGRL